VNTHPSRPGLSPLETAQKPFQYISMDFVTDLPLVKGYDSILTVVDQGLTKAIHLIPCAKTTTAADLINLLIAHVFSWFGLPDKIILDRGPQFASQLFQQTCHALGIHSALSTAFHPQTDGESEWVNQEIGTYLRLLLANDPTGWVHKLPMFEWYHNTNQHSATKQRPADLLFGFSPKLFPEAVPSLSNPVAESHLQWLIDIWTEAMATLQQARQLLQNCLSSSCPEFQEGDQVWLDSCHIHFPTPTKFTTWWHSPFCIKQRLSKWAYKLILPTTWHIHPIFHVSLISPFRETTAHGPQPLPPVPEIIDGQEEFEVEAILRHRTQRRWL